MDSQFFQFLIYQLITVALFIAVMLVVRRVVWCGALISISLISEKSLIHSRRKSN